MGRIYSIKNPSDNGINPIALEDNAVLLNGRFGEEVSIASGRLLAKDGLDKIYSLYKGQYGVFTQAWFPIGTNIYVNVGDAISYTSGVLRDLKVYTSYYNVSFVTNGGELSQFISQGVLLDSNDVFLEVDIDQTYSSWRPSDIAVSGTLTEGNFYIRLGSYTGNTGGATVPEQDSFMLEDNNPLFYYDGTNLIPWEVYLNSISTNYYKIIYLGSAQKIVSGNTVTKINDNTDTPKMTGMPSGTYKVTVQRHVESTEDSHNLYFLLRYTNDYTAATPVWQAVAATNRTICDPVKTGDPDITDLALESFTFVGIIILENTVPNTYRLELLQQGKLGDVFGNDVPTIGSSIDMTTNVDMILFERIGDVPIE